MSNRRTNNAEALMHNTRIGIDLGGTKIEAIAINTTGEIICRHRTSTPSNSYQEVVLKLQTVIESIAKQADLPKSTPVGIGTPGAISLKTGLMKNCNNTCLNGHDLKSDLEVVLKRPVRIANDADCFTLSEAVDGAGRDASMVFGIILGTGVGGGLTVNQQLLRGINSISGEWGHNALPLNSLAGISTFPFSQKRACYCGKLNCIETWLSGPALAESYFELTGLSMTAKQVSARISVDPQAQLAFDWYYNMAALAISQAINIVDPHVIVLGGGMSNTQALYAGIRSYWDQYIFSDQVDTHLEPARHGDASGVRGAAWLW